MSPSADLFKSVLPWRGHQLFTENYLQENIPSGFLWVPLADWVYSDLCCTSRCTGEVKSILHQQLFLLLCMQGQLHRPELSGAALLQCKWVGGVIFIKSYVRFIKLPLPFLVKPANLVLDVSNKAISRGWALTPTHLCVKNRNCFPICIEENQVNGKIRLTES